jgi:nitrate/nitrite transport system ATP-binding protein
MSFLNMSDVSVSFGVEDSKVEILNNINLDVAENEFVAVIGFSGSGKSTLISLLAGLQLPSSGEVTLEGNPIVQPSPELGIMFQNYSLLPWLSVFENIELAVKKVFPKLTSIQRRSHIGKYIEMVNLTPAIDKKPSELSGGMRQRASLARTLSMEPKILLLDEPLSALDALTRSSIQDEILNIWEKEKRTVVMITNDVDEAVLMADRIVPLTIGPNASLGNDFNIPLKRPRNRTTLNSSPEYKKLKKEITKFMLNMNSENIKLNKKSISLPAVFEKSINEIGPEALIA